MFETFGIESDEVVVVQKINHHQNGVVERMHHHRHPKRTRPKVEVAQERTQEKSRQESEEIAVKKTEHGGRRPNGGVGVLKPRFEEVLQAAPKEKFFAQSRAETHHEQGKNKGAGMVCEQHLLAQSLGLQAFFAQIGFETLPSFRKMNVGVPFLYGGDKRAEQKICAHAEQQKPDGDFGSELQKVGIGGALHIGKPQRGQEKAAAHGNALHKEQ